MPFSGIVLERLPFAPIRPMHAKPMVPSLRHLLQYSLESLAETYVVMINLLLNSALIPSTLSAWSLVRVTDPDLKYGEFGA